MTFWMVSTYPDGAMLKILLKSVEFKGFKNSLGLVSLMTLWMVCIWPEGAMFKIWLKSVEFEGIKNTLKDG